jgi:hypothetical protein
LFFLRPPVRRTVESMRVARELLWRPCLSIQSARKSTAPDAVPPAPAMIPRAITELSALFLDKA